MRINQDIALLAFIFGSGLLVYLPTLITGALFIVLSLLLLGLFSSYWLLSYRSWIIYFIGFGLFGLLWACLSAEQMLNNARPYVDKSISAIAIVKTVNIRVSSRPILPISTPSQNILVIFELKEINHHRLDKPILVQASYSDVIYQFYAGEEWHLILKLKALHSHLNQGSFDSQRWGLSRHLLLSATIQSAERILANYYLRQRIITHIVDKISSYSRSGIMIGLLFGERDNITRYEQQQLLYTGVGHLMAISGLHIMLVATAVFYLCRAMQKRLSTLFISMSFPLWTSFFAASVYVWLSGVNPPAQRALIAFLLVLLCRFNGLSLGAWQLWLRVVAVLIFIDPLTLLSDSFWLSCFAVACLIFLYQWLPLPARLKNNRLSYFWRLGHLQFGLLILLLPIQIAIFKGVSIVSIVANLIAIPLMTLVILPLLFIAMIMSLLDLVYLPDLIWFLANLSVELLFFMMDHIKGHWYWLSNQYRYVSIMGWLGILFWYIRIWRYFSVTLWLVLLLMISPFFQSRPYRWRLDMLDVGHGLAIVVRQGNAAILYDTGQRYLESSEAEKQIIPFLHWHQLDLIQIIISHQHHDHIGGLDTLRSVYPRASLISSSHQLANHINCIQGVTWQWQALHFEVLWPPTLAKYAVNEHSCVIKISDGRFSVLLTGDLEKAQEYLLTQSHINTLQSTILQVPHHGSNTSSSYAFLSKVKPELAINSAARYNPWHLPSVKSIERYDDLIIPLYHTHQQGQISIYFFEKNWRIISFRQHIKPRWYHDWFGSLCK